MAVTFASENKEKRNEVTRKIAELIMADGIPLQGYVRYVENMITFTSERLTYNVIVTVARKQEGMQ